MAERRQRRFKGQGASPGVAIGQAYVLLPDRVTVPRYRIPDEAVEAEVNRFKAALERVRRRFEALRSELAEAPTKEPLWIVEAQIQLLDDPQLREQTIAWIRDHQTNAEWALWTTSQSIIGMIAAVDDPYIRERAEDVRHLIARINQELLGGDEVAPHLPADAIVVARELAPDEAIRLARIPVAGMVTEGGSVVSHVAIIARTFDIPAVMGVEGITEFLSGGEPLVVDGVAGEVVVFPNQRTLASARRDQRLQRQRRQIMLQEASLPSVTPDGFHLALMANIELPEETELAAAYGAEGIGLYRTEYLFLTRSEPPDETEMLAEYTRVVRAMQGRPVTFRTVDIGGDKLPDALEVAVGQNPAMGMRGIRYSLQRPEFFRTQVRAILQAGRHGPVRILLPLVSGHDELLAAREHIAAVAAEVGVEAPVGVMIETPISVITADILARDADFFSIGTNDLIQYALAIDRTDESVAYLYAPLHLGVLRMIRQVVQVGRDSGIEVGVCGEMAGDPLFAMIFLGLEVSQLSMAPTAIPLVRAMVRRLRLQEARELVQAIFALESSADIEALLERTYKEKVGDLYE